MMRRRKQRRLAAKLLKLQSWRGNRDAEILAAVLGLEIS